MTARDPRQALTVFLTFLRLGCTSFGGPIAHLGYFRKTFVGALGWLDDATFSEIVAMCSVTPGATSSKVGISIGFYRAGLPGALAAWTAFTAPSAIALVLFALGVPAAGAGIGFIHGLIVAAVAVVAQAVWAMSRTLCPDWPRRILALASAALALFVAGSVGQLAPIVLGGIVGVFAFRSTGETGAHDLDLGIPHWAGIAAAVAFALLFVGLPLVAPLAPALRAFDAFFTGGSLVFGGGHVVLPLLQAQVVTPGWVSPDRFIAGYGAAQAVPGPLFTFASYLGTVMQVPPGAPRAGVAGALLATVAIFLPSFLFVIALGPSWRAMRRRPRWSAALRGINAAVVGLLLAALVHPVITSAIRPPQAGIVPFALDVALALAAFALLQFARWPAWAVVIAAAAAGALGA